MFQYEKRLQFPVKICKPDARAAQVIISQYGGPDGELAASLRYLSQRFAMPYPELKGLLTDIGIEDLFCAFIKVFVFSPLERGGASLYSPLSFFIPKEPRV